MRTSPTPRSRSIATTSRSHLSKAVDEVRREEAKHHRALLEEHPLHVAEARRRIFTDRQRDLLDELVAQPLATVRAYTLSLQFDGFYEIDDPGHRRGVPAPLDHRGRPKRPGAAGRSFASMLEDHWHGVIRWHHSRSLQRLLECLNSLIQAAKRRARGYRTSRNFITMIYLIVGKLNPGPITT